jgi:hypothetical protein
MRYTPIQFLLNLWRQFLARRRESELDRLQAELDQARWRNSLAEQTQDADLASGYNIDHFNTLQ